MSGTNGAAQPAEVLTAGRACADLEVPIRTAVFGGPIDVKSIGAKTLLPAYWADDIFGRLALVRGP